MARVRLSPEARACAVLGAMLAAGLGGVADHAGADATSPAGTLTTPWFYGAAASVGGFVYFLGGVDLGQGGALDTIWRFDPATGDVRTMGARLPFPLYATAAVGAGSHVFLFGGSTAGGPPLGTILRYTPATDTVTVMGATLPFAARDITAVWSGQYAYVFGGNYAPREFSRRVTRYDPATDTAQLLGGALPAPRLEMAGAWAGGAAYLFGGVGEGSDGSAVFSDDVLRYTPANDTVDHVADLPTPRLDAVGFGLDGFAYVIAGRDETTGRTFDDVLRFDAATNQVTAMSARLPSARFGGALAWDGKNAYLAGAFSISEGREIVRYNLGPGAPPTGLNASQLPAGTSLQGIQLRAGPRLNWTAPPANTYHPPLTYRVYRGTAPDNLAFVGQTSETQYADTRANPTARNYYAVAAANPYGEGPRSAGVCWRVIACTTSVDLVPLP